MTLSGSSAPHKPLLPTGASAGLINPQALSLCVLSPPDCFGVRVYAHANPCHGAVLQNVLQLRSQLEERQAAVEEAHKDSRDAACRQHWHRSLHWPGKHRTLMHLDGPLLSLISNCTTGVSPRRGAQLRRKHMRTAGDAACSRLWRRSLQWPGKRRSFLLTLLSGGAWKASWQRARTGRPAPQESSIPRRYCTTFS